MKAAHKPIVEKVVPMDESHLQKEYGLTPAQAKKAMEKMKALYAESKAKGQVIQVQGAFDESYFA